MGKSLKHKTIEGVSWSVINGISGSSILFVVGLILARILSPVEFGILGLISIFIEISNSIIDSGFSSALIRKSNANEKDYNTVFIFNLLVSILIYFILFIAAPLISTFFKMPQLVLITRVASLSIIFTALSIIQRTILIKNINFKTLTKISVLSSLLSGIIGISMAYNGYGVWSLAFQQLSKTLFYTIFLWVFNKWRPIFYFSKKSFNELFGFGSKLMISGIIDTIYLNSYYFIIGKFYSPALLGQYTRAEQFKRIFSQDLISAVQKVSYPVLSTMQSEEERLLLAQRKIIKTTMLITFALILGMAAVAKPMILILIGEKWSIAIQYLQIMCVAAMLYPLHNISLNILNVKGRSDLYLKLEIIKKIIAIFPIIIGIFTSIECLLIGNVVISFIFYFLNGYYSGRLINYPIKTQIKDIFPTFIVSLSTALIMWSFTLLEYNNWIVITIQLLVGLTIAFIAYEKIKLTEYIELKALVIIYFNKMVKRKS